MYNSALFYNRYKVLRKIGQGGMSSVYLCLDTHIKKEWVVKLIETKNGKVSFANSEINLLKSLDYYMFPRIVDAFYEDNSIGIVTDYIEGESLDSYLKREGALPVNIALKYYEELLGALIYLHSLNPPILYLDMKPSNIMLRPDGTIRLIDFGIARSILIKGKCYGSYGYSPPEQYEEGRIINEKADVFALAMTVYEMLTADEPSSDLIKQRLIIRENHNIPAAVKRIILSCTQQDENKRPMPLEVLELLKGKRASAKGVIPSVFILITVCIVFFIMLYSMLSIYRQKNYERHRENMLSEAAAYIEDGEYTRKGLSVIAGYVDGKLLDKDSEEYYTYKLAVNYFEVQKDYVNAQVYFKRLSRDKYPQVEEYLKICESMRGFLDSDEEIAKRLIFEVND